MGSHHDENRISREVFLKIKNERIAGRRNNAVTKRQDDLRRIRDMRSRHGIHPLELFPKEIWEKILDESSGPKDLGNALEVHDLFHEILDNRRIRDILFPQILNLKFSHFWKRPSNQEQERRYQNRKKKQRKPLAEFGMLREVSKSMRDGIDQWYENKIIQNLRNEKEAGIATFTCTFPGNESEESKLNGILANFSDSRNKAKHFFLRSLAIKIYLPEYEGDPDFIEGFKQFKTKTTKLLEIIGGQVWHFEWDISNLAELEAHGITFSLIYIAFKECTTLMPNIKWLVINNGLYCDYVTENETVMSGDGNIFKNHPFPHLEHLERICYILNSDNYISVFQVFSQVLMANSHVKALNIDPGIDEDENKEFFELHLNKLINSLSLDLEVFSIGTESSDSCKLQFIQPIVNDRNWNLKRMQLGFDASNVTLKSIFEFLENFQDLEHLTLHLVDLKFDDDIPFLRLPNLTHLELDLNYEEMKFTSGANFFFSLQFLLYARKLKRLVWNNQSYETVGRLRRFLINRECSDRMINFRGGIRDMRSSNVWDLFPDLEYVEVEIVKYEGSGVSKTRRGERL